MMNKLVQWTKYKSLVVCRACKTTDSNMSQCYVYAVIVFEWVLCLLFEEKKMLSVCVNRDFISSKTVCVSDYVLIDMSSLLRKYENRKSSVTWIRWSSTVDDISTAESLSVPIPSKLFYRTIWNTARILCAAVGHPIYVICISLRRQMRPACVQCAQWYAQINYIAIQTPKVETIISSSTIWVYARTWLMSYAYCSCIKYSSFGYVVYLADATAKCSSHILYFPRLAIATASSSSSFIQPKQAWFTHKLSYNKVRAFELYCYFLSSFILVLSYLIKFHKKINAEHV